MFFVSYFYTETYVLATTHGFVSQKCRLYDTTQWGYKNKENFTRTSKSSGNPATYELRRIVLNRIEISIITHLQYTKVKTSLHLSRFILLSVIRESQNQSAYIEISIVICNMQKSRPVCINRDFYCYMQYAKVKTSLHISRFLLLSVIRKSQDQSTYIEISIVICNTQKSRPVCIYRNFYWYLQYAKVKTSLHISKFLSVICKSQDQSAYIEIFIFICSMQKSRPVCIYRDFYCYL